MIAMVRSDRLTNTRNQWRGAIACGGRLICSGLQDHFAPSRKTMSLTQITDYFNFLTPGDIRLKGSRIGIETILYEYIDRGRTPEEIAQIYTSLSLEQVYATILYYLQNKEVVSAYIKNWIEHGHRMREEQRLNPPPVSEKLRQLRAERKAKKQANGIEISD